MCHLLRHLRIFPLPEKKFPQGTPNPPTCLLRSICWYFGVLWAMNFEISQLVVSVGWRQAGTLRRRPPVDPGDAEALRRRVRALQKKLREIEKLKVSWTCWEGSFFFLLSCGIRWVWVHEVFFFFRILLWKGVSEFFGLGCRNFTSTMSFLLECWSWKMMAVFEGWFRLWLPECYLLEGDCSMIQVSKNERYSRPVCPHFTSLPALDSHFG